MFRNIFTNKSNDQQPPPSSSNLNITITDHQLNQTIPTQTSKLATTNPQLHNHNHQIKKHINMQLTT
ncbi:hypothetical protein Hanom_Chr08g00710801 [Helianthus anomalus]